MKHTKVQIIGLGELCPKCSLPMERRKHAIRPTSHWFYKEWDYCKGCRHLQHYERYKCAEWKESEEKSNFFDNIS